MSTDREAPVAAKRTSPATPHSKAARQARIAALIATNDVHSQTQLVDLLAADRVDVTQATLSRDLEEMGAVKVRRPGVGTVYAVSVDRKSVV